MGQIWYSWTDRRWKNQDLQKNWSFNKKYKVEYEILHPYARKTTCPTEGMVDYQSNDLKFVGFGKASHNQYNKQNTQILK